MSSSRISIIAAIGKNRELGKNNTLLWKIPDDLKRFKVLTSGHPVVMGRKTFESLGRPLPNRVNIVVTRNETWKPEGVTIVHSLSDGISLAQQLDSVEIFILGGGEIYSEALPLSNRLYLTVINDEKEADTFFPEYKNLFNLTSEEKHHDAQLGIDYSFQILEK
ncbi:MAG: dihydrofolate reductase [Candidatus Paceibacterota bacterium]